jgi:mono/diheme cytochrome c family protein
MKLVIFQIILLFFISIHLGEAVPMEGLRSIFEENCVHCHNTRKSKGGYNLEQMLVKKDFYKDYVFWEKIHEVITTQQMPPKDETALSSQEIKKVSSWLVDQMKLVTQANSGTPGLVSLRRLTHLEYERSLEDLTGVNIPIKDHFNSESAGGEGFTNAADLMFLPPEQMNKYIAAARKITSYAEFLPQTGLRFGNSPFNKRSDQEAYDSLKLEVNTIVQKMATSYLPAEKADYREQDYLVAAWQWHYRNHFQITDAVAFLKLKGLSEFIFENWYRFLTDPIENQPNTRFTSGIRRLWQQLPAPKPSELAVVPDCIIKECGEIQKIRKAWYCHPDFYLNPSREITPEFYMSIQRKIQDSDHLMPFSVHFRRPKGSQHTKVNLLISDLGDGNEGDFLLLRNLTVMYKNNKKSLYLDWLQNYIKELRLRMKVNATETLKKEMIEAEQSMDFLNQHRVQGAQENEYFFQAPLQVTLIFPQECYDLKGNIWVDITKPMINEASFQVALADPQVSIPPDGIIPGGYIKFVRQQKKHASIMTDLNIMREQFPDEALRAMEITAKSVILRDKIKKVYALSADQIKTIATKDQQYNCINLIEDLHLIDEIINNPKKSLSWKDKAKQECLVFAQKAWRRPLSVDEKRILMNRFDESHLQNSNLEVVVKEMIVKILCSVHFLFRLELIPDLGKSSLKETPVSQWQLATRLSYFLWGSMPDEILFYHANKGSLLGGQQLEKEVLRMLKHPRVDGFIRQFFTQWLEIDDFESHEGVDLTQFPEFTPELKKAYDEEMIHFIESVLHEDGSIHSLTQANYSYINDTLAKVYNIPNIEGAHFRKVDMSAVKRGGLITQGAFLTKTSRGHRTSPVLRGNWLLKSVLGKPVPPPPNDVPPLKEARAVPTSVRQMLEEHRANQACASCHDRIDPLGFALESFDAIGRYRLNDDSHTLVNAKSTIKGFGEIDGIDGLKKYLKTEQPTINMNFCKKLIGFALGRSYLPTDLALLNEMLRALEVNQGKISAAIITLVKSRQFQNKTLQADG